MYVYVCAVPNCNKYSTIASSSYQNTCGQDALSALFIQVVSLKVYNLPCLRTGCCYTSATYPVTVLEASGED